MAGPPSRIILIRHAEKPPEAGGPPFGVTVEGARSVHALTVRGWQRAGALAVLFAPFAGSPPRGLARPDHLICSDDGGATEKRRVYQTLVPLADRLGLGIDHPFPADEAGSLYEGALASLGGVVLVCWDHHGLASIAANVPVVARALVPGSWPDHRFDLAWAFDFAPAKGAYRFRVVPQRVLADDGDPP